MVYSKNKESVCKKDYQTSYFPIAILVCGFFAKESVIKEYVPPVKGIIAAGTALKISDGDTLTFLSGQINAKLLWLIS